MYRGGGIMIQLAAEVGGTFTDLIWTDGTGRVRTHKVPSTPSDPSQAVIHALDECLGKDAPLLRRLFHGSTVATNAVLERKGGRTALVTTRGYKDILVLQRQTRPNVNSIVCRKPEPLVPLRRTIEATERVSVNGEVVVPVDERDFLDAMDRLMNSEDPEALAVCLLHSYRSPAHERRIRKLVKERYPRLEVALSSDVLPTFREYERASTTVMAAYLAPLVSGYVEHLERELQSRSPEASLFIMQSSGGILPGAGARARPVEMLNSGPAAGVIAAVRIAELLGDSDLITLDVGGTSADMCLVDGGVPEVTAEREVDGLPVGISSLDIANVGAGGGSIAWIDRGGMLRVGPESAGARPGPACYGCGGEAPTVTDALVHLGWIRPHRFLGGRMKLLPERAARVLDRLPGPLGLSTLDVARAVVDVSAAHVSRGVRLVSVQRGRDPKGYVLYAYGGMGPVVAALVAEELGIRRVVVPPLPGLFSALGLLVADLKREYRETCFLPVGRDAADRIEEAFARMEAEARRELLGYGSSPDEIEWQRHLEMRSQGQGFELRALIDPDRLRAEGHGYLVDLFEETHRARYGTSPANENIEVVTFRLVAGVPGSRGILDQLHPEGKSGNMEEGAMQFRGDSRNCGFAWRESFGVGDRLEGLAILEEPTATTLVPPGWRAQVARAGALVLERGEGA
jgi:N-methylhydantoinase A